MVLDHGHWSVQQEAEESPPYWLLPAGTAGAGQWALLIQLHAH